MTISMFDMTGRVALVTGGAGGLGQAIAKVLIGAGATVALADRDADGCREVAEAIDADPIPLDVTRESDWADAIASIRQRRGRLDLLVNGAGIEGNMGADNPGDMAFDAWKQVFAVNVDGTFLGCRAALPLIAASGGGSIVNLSSVASMRATPFSIAYGSSKAAVRQLTMSVAVYCGEKKNLIRCNSIHPGPVQTAMLDRTIDGIAKAAGISFEEFRRQYTGMVPQGEFQEPDDVAAAVLYLVADSGRHVTGAELVIDGGLAIRL